MPNKKPINGAPYEKLLQMVSQNAFQSTLFLLLYKYILLPTGMIIIVYLYLFHS